MSVRNKGKWIVATCVLALLLFVGVGVTSISSTQAYAEETKVEISVAQSASQTKEINMDNTIETFTNETYISHPEYFWANPRHADNKTSDNLVGTCTTVAMQMVMGYHNYYTDRRLIPQKTEDGKEFLCGDYGIPECNPAIDMSHISDHDHLGCAEIGTEDAFFYELFRLNRFADDAPFGQAIGFVAAGATDFVGMYASEIADSVTIASSFSPMEHAMEEIDAGRPIILGIQPLGNPADSFHVMVAYGYATLNGELGFIVHKGWYDVDLRVWVPASQFWCDIRMSVGHEHTIIDTEENWPESKSETPVTPTHRKIKCAVCGYHAVDPLYETNPVGDAITALRYPMAEVEIPSRLNNQRITTIGNSAFAESDIRKIKLTTNIVDIESNAFADCRQLTEITSFGNVRTIGMQAFKNCTALTNVTLPSTVVSVGVGAFTGCDNINLTVSPNNRNYSVQNNILYNKNKTELIQAYNRDSDITILPSVRTIAPYAFFDNRFIETVRIDGVSDIGEQAFAGCVNLYAVFCKSVEPPTVGQDIFMGLTLDKNFAIYVPYRVQDGYKAAFGSYAEFVKSYPVEVQLISDGVIVERLNWYDGMIIENLPVPKCTGKTFGGWYDSPEYEGTAYQDGDILESQTNITLYAKWTANQYTITMDPKNGEAKSTEDVEFGKPFKLSVPTLEGHVFEGWRDTNGVFITTKSGDSFEPWNRAENIEVYADWRIELYYIKVEEDGKTIAWLGPKGFADEQEGIAYGTKLVAINLIQIFKESKYGFKEGEIFHKFECLDEIIQDGRVGDLGSDGCVVVIRPIWELEEHSIHLHTQRDLVVPTIQEFYGMPITLPTISLLGETFEGWFTESVGGKKVEWDHMPDLTPNEQNNGSRDLYAHWTRNTYTVEYNPNGGGGTMASTKHTYGQQQALRKNMFTKYGHEFIGWATSSSGGVVYADEAKVPDLTDKNNVTVELFAVWEACRYDIICKNMMPDMRSGMPWYVYGQGIDSLPEPYGYTDGRVYSIGRFFGWYSNARFTNRVTSISKTQTGVVILYAKYEYWMGGSFASGYTQTVTDDDGEQPNIEKFLPMQIHQAQLQGTTLKRLRMEIEIRMWEVNDGYQDFSLNITNQNGDRINRGGIYYNEDFDHEKDSISLEHGGNKKNTSAQTYKFTFTIDLTKYSDMEYLTLQLGAHGFAADTWQFDYLSTDLYFID